MKDRLTLGVVASALLGGALAIVLVVVWAAFWAGFTLSALWGWFIVPIFGLPALSVAQAYGVTLVLGATRGYRREAKSDDSFGTVVAKGVVIPPFVAGLLLLVGWITKAWV